VVADPGRRGQLGDIAIQSLERDYVGHLADGRRYLATIEPWHGFQVVVYTPPPTTGTLWGRRVIDEPVQWGHAAWCADLDGDGDQELIIGQRDPN
jgi:hypothetical protein